MFDTTVVDTGNILSNLLAELVALETMTVARLIGHLDFQAGPADENEYAQIITIGIGVCSVEAFNVGVTAVPDLDVAAETPARGWLYRARRLSLQALPTGGTPVAIHRQPAIFSFDVRAMRKIDRGRLFMYIKNSTTGGNALSMEVVGLVRAMALT